MEINIENKVPNVKVAVNKAEDGSVSIVLSEEKRLTLGEVACGKVVKLGEREFYVLGHGADTSAVLAKDANYMSFDGGGDY